MREVISHRWEKKTIYIEYEWSFTLEIELVMLYSENVTSELHTKPKNQIYFMNVLKMKLLIKKQNRPSSFNFQPTTKVLWKSIKITNSCPVLMHKQLTVILHIPNSMKHFNQIRKTQRNDKMLVVIITKNLKLKR